MIAFKFLSFATFGMKESKIKFAQNELIAKMAITRRKKIAIISGIFHMVNDPEVRQF